MYISGATSIGYAHEKYDPPMPNQDRYRIARYRKGVLVEDGTTEADDTIIVAVYDGCSSCKNAHVGATFAAEVLPGIINEQIGDSLSLKDLDWDQVHVAFMVRIYEKVRSTLNDTDTKTAKGIVQKIADLASEVCGLVTERFKDAIKDAIMDAYLFTVIVSVIRGDEFVIAYAGDGIIAVDDDVFEIPLTVRNTPPYPAYQLVARFMTSPIQKQILKRSRFQVVRSLGPMKNGCGRVSDLKTGIVIATDGAVDLIVEEIHSAAIEEHGHQRWLNKKVSLHQPDDDATFIVVHPDATLTAERKESHGETERTDSPVS